MHLAVEVGGAGRHPGAARGTDPLALLDPARTAGLVRLAAARGLDLVVLPDPVATAADAVAPLDAVALAAQVAPVVPAIGLVPQATVAGAEPVPLARALAALDVLSGGRAGWEPVVPWAADGSAAPADARWREAGEVVDRVARLWDSREHGAGTPRPPHGRPVVVVRGDGPGSPVVAARSADVVRIAAPGLEAARDAHRRVRAAVAAAGRRPDDVTVLLDVEVHLAGDGRLARAGLRALDAVEELPPSTVRVTGTPTDVAGLLERVVRLRAADGVTFLPLALPADLRALTGRVVPLLAGRGLFRPGSAGAGLRARLGLPRPADRRTVEARLVSRTQIHPAPRRPAARGAA
jgi:alkanesulfonate monooxygenase SsuD/methylene tetrahydromethanopterin reductase-like flavin-dependent oxidoreductase (luciferase family)